MSIVSLEPKLGHPSNLFTQLGWDAVQFREAVVLTSMLSLSDRGVPTVDHIVARVQLRADGPKGEREDAPEPCQLPIGVPVATVSDILRRESSHYWPGFQKTRRRILQ